ncbi:Protein of unknown function, partial [Gryllus bimaculatus]
MREGYVAIQDLDAALQQNLVEEEAAPAGDGAHVVEEYVDTQTRMVAYRLPAAGHCYLERLKELKALNATGGVPATRTLYASHVQLSKREVGAPQ